MPNKQRSIIWTNADTIHSRIDAALGEDELIYCVKRPLRGHSYVFLLLLKFRTLRSKYRMHMACFVRGAYNRTVNTYGMRFGTNIGYMLNVLTFEISLELILNESSARLIGPIPLDYSE